MIDLLDAQILLKSGTLHQHLAKIVISVMAKQEGVAEVLGATDQIEWMLRMDNIQRNLKGTDA